MRGDLLRSLAVALVAATALAGCSVDVEGARCDVVGSTADCPAGQRCGTALTCSVRAAGCAPCVVGALDCRAGQKDVMACSADGDPACGTWTPAITCDAALQACQRPPAGAPECVCASWTVVPGGSAAVCTRPSIALAIAEAVKFPDPKVLLGGAAGATYGNELDDQAPIVIPAGLTLIGDGTATAAATNRIIAVQGPGPEGLLVHGGAVLRGVAVQRADAGGPAVGVGLMGGAAASGNTLEAVRIDAGGAGLGFGVGLRVAGANVVAVGDVLVQGATVAGLEVNRLSAADVVLVDRSVFDGNQVGVSLLRGDLTLSGSVVKRSGGEGVRANSRAGSSLSMQGGQVSQSGTIGLVLEANDRLRLEGVRICANAGVNRTVLGTTRKVGGIFALDAPPSLQAIEGNLIHNNGGDQVLFGAAASGTWMMAATSCGAASNVVTGYVAVEGVGVTALSASVDARNVAWKTVSPPSLGIDFFTDIAGVVDARGLGTEFCAPVVTGECPP